MKKQNSAIIPANVRRFGHAINTDEVFGTHKELIAEQRPQRASDALTAGAVMPRL